MFTAPDEAHYQRQYLDWITRAWAATGQEPPRTVLDLGCGQGRLLIPLARRHPASECAGVDLSTHAVTQARDYAAREGVTNVRFRDIRIEQALAEAAPESVELVIMTEVTLFMPEWRRALDRMSEVVRPGGLMAVAFRSQYFDALCVAQTRRWEQVDTLLQARKGKLFGGDTVFTWQTSGEIRRLIEDEFGFELLELVGIGCCSGISGDPHAEIVRPSVLGATEAADLLRLELALARDVPDAGRYLLAVARKPSA